MGVNRRQWLSLSGRLLAVASGMTLWLLRHSLPARYVQAVRGRDYPGPLRTSLSDRDINRPGKWKG